MRKNKVEKMSPYAIFRLMQEGPENYVLAEEIAAGYGMAFGIVMRTKAGATDALARLQKGQDNAN